MQALRRTVMAVLDVERKGGRLLARDDCTLVLANMEFAAQAALALIAEQHPCTDISVSNSAASSSGYIIVFTRRPQRALWQTSACAQLVLTGACLLAGAWLWRAPLAP